MINQIRKAGKAIADFDRAYAGKVASHIDPQKQPLLEMGSAVPLADIAASKIASELRTTASAEVA